MALLHLLVPVCAQAAGSALARGVVRTSEKVESMAGGWRFATPLIVAGTNLIQSTLGEDDFKTEDLTNREFLTGLGADFALVGLTRMVVRSLPIPALAKVALMTSAGFLGWEIGTGNLSRTDWALLATEVGAATALQVGLPILLAAAGLSLAPIAITALTIGGTLAVGALFDHLRKKMRSQGGDGPGGEVEGERTPPADQRETLQGGAYGDYQGPALRSHSEGEGETSYSTRIDGGTSQQEETGIPNFGGLVGGGTFSTP
jgi:hypothetical protein